MTDDNVIPIPPGRFMTDDEVAALPVLSLGFDGSDVSDEPVIGYPQAPAGPGFAEVVVEVVANVGRFTDALIDVAAKLGRHIDEVVYRRACRRPGVYRSDCRGWRREGDDYVVELVGRREIRLSRGTR